MREYRFRGYGINIRKWYEGSLVVDDDPSHIDHPVRISNHGSYVTVDPGSVGQFTGRTDRDGKPIYEGDILEICNGSINRIPLVSQITVRWNDQMTCFNVPTFSAFVDDTHWYRVIGCAYRGADEESRR